MIGQFLKIVYRNLTRKGKMSLLNIIGLSLGIASFMVIALHVIQETTYEAGFAKADRTYRINTRFLNASVFATSTKNTRSFLAEQPEFESVTQLSRLNKGFASVDDIKHPISEYYYIDSVFHDVFNFELLHGIEELAFKQENSLILVEREAIRLFGRTDVIGEKLTIGASELEIAGVIRLDYFRTHLQFNGLVVNRPTPYQKKYWSFLGEYTYAVAYPSVTTEQIDQRLELMARDFIFPAISSQLNFVEGYSYEDWIASDSHIRNYAQPIADIHLKSDLSAEMAIGGDVRTVLTFGLIALFIIVISCANYINLSTAKASERSKELGIKKVLGITRFSLASQLLAESLLVTLCAGILALGLTEMALQLLSQVMVEFQNISLADSPLILSALMAFVLLVGLLAGLYPAWYLSSIRVNALLKGQKTGGFAGVKTAGRFRNMLVVVQFILSSGLIICAIFISRQLNHMQGLDLGFEDDGVIVITNPNKASNEKIPLIRQEMERLPFVKEISSMLRVPGASSTQGWARVMTDIPNGTKAYIDWFQGDADQFKVLGVEMAEGRAFSTEIQSDMREAIVINEAAARLYGDIPVLGSTFYGRTVIGVVKDFHFESLRVPVRPAMFHYQPEGGKLVVKMEMNEENMARLQAIWQATTALPMTYSYLEENYEDLMGEEARLRDAFGLFTILAIFISCLGMYGLALYAADQRAKELSIRKVLGASVKDLIRLLTGNFLKLVLISMLLAIPMSFFGVRAWLSSFAYRIDLSATVFVLSALMVLFLVIVTVFHQSYKAAIANPAETLKNE